MFYYNKLATLLRSISMNISLALDQTSRRVRVLVPKLPRREWHVAFLLLVSAPLATAAPPPLNWTQLSPGTSPSARSHVAMAYDPVSRDVILFGGFTGAAYSDETWAFDGTTWTNINTPIAPPARAAAQMAYDSVSGKVVLFGGTNHIIDFNDTWIWDGATLTWTPTSPVHSPGNLTGPLVFRDPNGRVDEFGGFDGTLFSLKMWQWNGSDWISLHPSMVPSARAWAPVATGLPHRQVVLFGGLASVNPDNTWTYNGVTWTPHPAATQPPLLYYTAAAFDPNLNTAVLFGGGSGGVDQDTTWAWTGANWHQLFPAQSPSAREAMGLVFDEALDRVILFGGQLPGSTFTYFNDTWELTP
jgi:hypothetical protein